MFGIDSSGAKKGWCTMATPSDTLQVEVWSDPLCSWCYIGKRKLDAAIASFEHPVEVRWRSYELVPEAPADYELTGADAAADVHEISPEEAWERQLEITAIAAKVGIEFHMERFRLGSSFDAHRMLQLAATYGRQTELEEVLMRAQLTDGELLSDHATLQRLALEVGLPVGEVDAVLASDRFTDEVRADEQAAARIPLEQVPTVLVNGHFKAAGSFSTEDLVSLLEEAWNARTDDVSELVPTLPANTSSSTDLPGSGYRLKKTK
ncbi:MAG: disulfide bond formation protein DsbA [Ilumatobacteraceae bacterium]|nr:disulfide bond formation protein DsbA [Ilumatobacteraceae bacterium]